SRNRFWDVSGKEPVMYQGTTPLTLSQWQNLYGMDPESAVEEPSQELLDKLPAELRERLGL
ncbi:MAG: hypothetical protein IKU11_04780, partial [Clostridia bacterium]|nr:hypothetical protein [Clostridia bacterium]